MSMFTVEMVDLSQDKSDWYEKQNYEVLRTLMLLKSNRKWSNR